MYIITALNAETFTILEPCEETIICLPYSMLSYFGLPYCFTVHSIQGLTINEPITIFDANTNYLDRRFIWTAITRASDLNNVNIFLQSDYEISRSRNSHMNLYFKQKVDQYKQQDKKAHRDIVEDEYINMDWIYEQLNTHPFCGGHHDIVCGEPFEYYIDEKNTVVSNVTCDRLNNNLCHSKLNCQLMCVDCNKAKSCY